MRDLSHSVESTDARTKMFRVIASLSKSFLNDSRNHRMDENRYPYKFSEDGMPMQELG